MFTVNKLHVLAYLTVIVASGTARAATKKISCQSPNVRVVVVQAERGGWGLARIDVPSRPSADGFSVEVVRLGYELGYFADHQTDPDQPHFINKGSVNRIVDIDVGSPTDLRDAGRVFSLGWELHSGAAAAPREAALHVAIGEGAGRIVFDGDVSCEGLW